MRTVTLINDFHNSEVRVRPSGPHGDVLSARQVTRVRRELCGIEGCCCGGVRGGEHALEERPDGTALVVSRLEVFGG